MLKKEVQYINNVPSGMHPYFSATEIHEKALNKLEHILELAGLASNAIQRGSRRNACLFSGKKNKLKFCSCEIALVDLYLCH